MFAAHGFWQYVFRPPCLYLRAEGTFNVQGLQAYVEDIEEALASQPAGAIRHVIMDLKRWELITADGLSDMKAYFARVDMRGYQSLDVLNASSMGRQILESMWPEGQLEIRFFDGAESYYARFPERRPPEAWYEGG